MDAVERFTLVKNRSEILQTLPANIKLEDAINELHYINADLVGYSDISSNNTVELIFVTRSFRCYLVDSPHIIKSYPYDLPEEGMYKEQLVCKLSDDEIKYISCFGEGYFITDGCNNILVKYGSDFSKEDVVGSIMALKDYFLRNKIIMIRLLQANKDGDVSHITDIAVREENSLDSSSKSSESNQNFLENTKKQDVYLVCVTGGQAPTRTYTSLADAEKEAKRLAALPSNIGKLVRVVKEEKSFMAKTEVQECGK